MHNLAKNRERERERRIRDLADTACVKEDMEIYYQMVSPY